MKLIYLLLAALTLCLALPLSGAQEANNTQQGKSAQVGKLADNSYLVATGQRISAAGEQIEFFGRPVDLALSPTGDMLAVKNSHGLILIDPALKQVRQILNFADISFDYVPHLGGASFVGIAWEHSSRNIWISDAYAELHRASLQRDGTFKWTKKILLPGPRKPRPEGDRSESQDYRASDQAAPSTPGGIAIDEGDKLLYVTLSQNNGLGIVELSSGKLVGMIPTGVAPFAVLLCGDRAFVSNWGGRVTRPGDTTSPSAGTQVVVDSSGAAKSGTVSILDLRKRTAVAEIEVGLHPSGMALKADGKQLFVANANSDTVSVIDLVHLRQLDTIPVSPDRSLPFGNEPNAVAADPDGKTLYIACGGDNAIAVFDLVERRMKGFVPTAWYPGSVIVDHARKKLYVANVKGIGSFGQERGYPPNFIKRRVGGKNAYDYAGSVSAVPIPDEITLSKHTDEVRSNLSYTTDSRTAPGSAGSSGVPVPASPRDVSVFKHVIYIIKENRTYDEILGDIKQGNGDARLCMFCGEVTPNHHALAEQFVLFDNFYVNGLLSADGHQWTDEGIATDYVEKNMGGFSRSYPSDGTDPLAYSPAGFIWDEVLQKGLTFRNYGEFLESRLVTDPKNATWRDFYRDYVTGSRQIEFQQAIFVATLKKHTSANYPPFSPVIPDVYRAQRFVEEFRQFEATDSLPSLITLQLGNDHTSGLDPGMPSPRAAVADNDLALGQIVEAVSHSKYWKDTAIFVVEDDAQDGLDHVDGRRSLAFVISAYTRRGATDSTFYNQNSVLRTIELILGLSPLTLFDYFANTMAPAFLTAPDFTPYEAVANRIPLDEMNPEISALKGTHRKLAQWSNAMDFSVPDRVDAERLNRVLWFAIRGDEPYPGRASLDHW